MYSSNYRLFFLLCVTKFLVPPLILAAVICLVCGISTVGWRLFLWFSCVPLYWTAKVQYDRRMARRIAHQSGAVLAPEVKGRWPGNIDIMFRLRDDTYVSRQYEEIFEQMGEHTVNLRLLWQDMIVTRDHQVIKEVLSTRFEEFGKGPIYKIRLFSLLGDGIFANDGEVWRARRALARPFFARSRVCDLEQFEKHSHKVVNILRRCAIAGESLDVQDLFGRFTLDVAGSFLFGTKDLNTLDEALPRPGHATLGPKGTKMNGSYGTFLQAFEDLQMVLPLRFSRSVLWPAFELWADSAQRHNKTIDDWVRPHILEALETKVERGENRMGSLDGSYLDHLVNSTMENRAIRDELINILLAARDTTAALLTTVIYMLALHPEVTQRLRREIGSVIPTGCLTYKDIRQLQYLRAVLNETLRLFPPVPQNERQPFRPTWLPSTRSDGKPIYIPHAYTPIRYQSLLTMRRLDLWGADACEFRPERWMDQGSMRVPVAESHRFIPFNCGPRICLGQDFAYNEASFLLVRILQTFDTFELRQKEDAPVGSTPVPERQGVGRYAIEQVCPRQAVTLYFKGGMWIRMRLAKEPIHNL